MRQPCHRSRCCPATSRPGGIFFLRATNQSRGCKSGGGVRWTRSRSVWLVLIADTRLIVPKAVARLRAVLELGAAVGVPKVSRGICAGACPARACTSPRCRSGSAMSAIALSFVIPLYKSAETIAAVVRDIESLEIEGVHEIVLVNEMVSPKVTTTFIHPQGIEEYLPKLVAEVHGRRLMAGYGVFVSQDQKETTRPIPMIGQGGLGLPDRDYYVKDDAKSKEIRETYVGHVEKMLGLAGVPAKDAKKAAEDVKAPGTEIAKVSKKRVERRDPDHGPLPAASHPEGRQGSEETRGRSSRFHRSARRGSRHSASREDLTSGDVGGCAGHRDDGRRAAAAGADHRRRETAPDRADRAR